MQSLLTVVQAAERCGISSRQVYKLLSSGRFGPELLRIGRSVRVRADRLDQWIEAGCPSRDVFEDETARGRR